MALSKHASSKAFGAGRQTQAFKPVTPCTSAPFTRPHACRTSCRASVSQAHQDRQESASSVQSGLIQHMGRCAGAIAAALVLTSSWECSPVAAAQMAAQEPYAMSEDALKAEESRYDENLMTKELRSFLELLDKKGANIKAEELQGPRSKVGFRRAPDGRVSLKARDGQWYSIKADMLTPGFMLLRAERDGTMYFLPQDDAGQLMQIDLSDDAVVAQLFASGAWFDVMDPLEVETVPGQLEPLRLSELDFRLTTSLLDGAEETQ